MRFDKIRAYFKGQDVNKVRLFLIWNLGLFVIAAVFWVQPVMSSWGNYRDVIRRQQNLYDFYTRQVADYDEGIESLIAYMPRRVLNYGQLAAAMASVRELALNYGMDVTHFDAAEPFSHEAEEGRFVELRLEAAFAGERSAEFVQSLTDSAAFIRRLRFELEDATVLWVELSFFGR